MMYNPYQYQVTMPQMQQMPQIQTPANPDERIWVQNETAAESYLVAPGGFVRLWDSAKQVFYEKRADNSGRPYPMDVYEYTRREEKTETVDYADMISKLEARIEALEGKRGKSNGTKSNADDTDAQ